MSDRILVTPFLVAPQGRTPSAQETWELPKGRREPPQRPRSVWAMIVAAWRRHQTRMALARLDAHLLKDIGLTYAEAENEMNKPFWRA
jgi:uncharacterized protein YjiS (DUF1127 family)